MAAGLCLIGLVGCGASDPDRTATPPDGRAVVVSTEGCGLASGATSSGVAVGGDLVVTAGHAVARSSAIRVTDPDGADHGAVAVAVDEAADLALLRVDGFAARTGSTPVTSIRVVAAEAGEAVTIVSGASTGTSTGPVLRVAAITVDAVAGSDGHRRVGYEVDVATATGDSGAGAYDGDGALVGVVFAVGGTPDRPTTWLTASSEVAELLASGPWTDLSCDPEASRVVGVGG